MFFGREEQVDDLGLKLEQNHFVAVVGPSGCGKSSLVYAGLLPELESGLLLDVRGSWRFMVMRPGDLIAFSRQTYTKPEAVEIWGRDDLIGSGLAPDERDLLKRIPLSNGRLLLLGVGGGREAAHQLHRDREL